MKKRVPIEEVAQRFAALSFDDTRGKQHCRSLLVKLQAEHDVLPRDGVAGVAGAAAMIQGMRALVAAIDEHLAGEFMALPELFDSKFNHHHVLFWIVVRDYDGLKKATDVFPDWYPGLSRLMDWNADCKTVATSMIAYLDKA